MKQYIQDKIKELNKEYDVLSKLNNYDGEYGKCWKRERETIAQYVWRETMNVSDVMNYVDKFIGSVTFEMGLKTCDLNIYETDLALYRVIKSIEKMAQCYENSLLDFNTLEKEDIDSMFDKLNEYCRKMQDERQRRSMYD